jgi:hypothetical protein
VASRIRRTTAGATASILASTDAAEIRTCGRSHGEQRSNTHVTELSAVMRRLPPFYWSLPDHVGSGTCETSANRNEHPNNIRLHSPLTSGMTAPMMPGGMVCLN